MFCQKKVMLSNLINARPEMTNINQRCGVDKVQGAGKYANR